MGCQWSVFDVSWGPHSGLGPISILDKGTLQAYGSRLDGSSPPSKPCSWPSMHNIQIKRDQQLRVFDAYHNTRSAGRRWRKAKRLHSSRAVESSWMLTELDGRILRTAMSFVWLWNLGWSWFSKKDPEKNRPFLYDFCDFVTTSTTAERSGLLELKAWLTVK